MAAENKTDHISAQLTDLSIEDILTCPISLIVPQDACVDSNGCIFDTSVLTGWLQRDAQHPLTRELLKIEDFKPVPNEPLFAPLRELVEGGCSDKKSIYNPRELIEFEKKIGREPANN